MSAPLVVVPHEEIVEPIHLTAGPGYMACGAEEGLAVMDHERVTCEGCLERASQAAPSADFWKRWIDDYAPEAW